MVFRNEQFLQIEYSSLIKSTTLPFLLLRVNPATNQVIPSFLEIINNRISSKAINHHRLHTGSIWCCHHILTVQNTFFFFPSKVKKDSSTLLFFPISFFFALEVWLKWCVIYTTMPMRQKCQTPFNHIYLFCRLFKLGSKRKPAQNHPDSF